MGWLRGLLADASLSAASTSSRSALNRRAEEIRKCKRVLRSRDYLLRCRSAIREGVSKSLVVAALRRNGPCDKGGEETPAVDKVVETVTAMCGGEEWFGVSREEEQEDKYVT